MKIFLVCCFFLQVSPALAEVVVVPSKSGGDIHIQVKQETIESTLRYYQKMYGTTSTLATSISQDSINADIKAKSLLIGTQRLFRGYNLAIILGKGDSISHITVFPVGDKSEHLITKDIGMVNSKNKTISEHSRKRHTRGWRQYPGLEFQHSWKHSPIWRHSSTWRLSSVASRPDDSPYQTKDHGKRRIR